MTDEGHVNSIPLKSPSNSPVQIESARLWGLHTGESDLLLQSEDEPHKSHHRSLVVTNQLYKLVVYILKTLRDVLGEPVNFWLHDRGDYQRRAKALKPSNVSI